MIPYALQTYCRGYREHLAQTRLRVVSVAGEPISVDEAAMHCRIDAYEVVNGGSPTESDYEERAWLEAAITAAREYCEGWTGLAIAPQTLELGTNAFPGSVGYGGDYCARYSVDCCGGVSSFAASGIVLGTAPVIAVQTVNYTDADNVPQTTPGSDYLLDDFAQPAVLYSAYGGSWPSSVLGIPNGVRIVFDAGYALPGDSPSEPALPKSIRQAMLLVVGHMYEHREGVSEKQMHELEMGVYALLERWRIRTGMA